MTVTYDLTTDIGKVRLHINDTDTASGKLTDAEIQYALTEKATVGGAVVWCLEFLRAKVADPNFTANWLTVDNSTAFKSLTTLLNSKRNEFGISSFTATAVHTYRADSSASAEPDFSETQSSSDNDDSSVIVIEIPI